MLIGTAHVIDLALPLERHIKNFNPDIIALELDKQRWLALKSNVRKSEGPFYVRLLSRLQQYLGDYFGSTPGAEMMVATNIANSFFPLGNLLKSTGMSFNEVKSKLCVVGSPVTGDTSSNS